MSEAVSLEQATRVNRAAAFRWASRPGMGESNATARSTGRPLVLIAQPVAARAGAQWYNDPTRFSELHFQALKDILDRQEPDYTR